MIGKRMTKQSIYHSHHSFFVYHGAQLLPLAQRQRVLHPHCFSLQVLQLILEQRLLHVRNSSLYLFLTQPLQKHLLAVLHHHRLLQHCVCSTCHHLVHVLLGAGCPKLDFNL